MNQIVDKIGQNFLTQKRSKILPKLYLEKTSKTVKKLPKKCRKIAENMSKNVENLRKNVRKSQKNAEEMSKKRRKPSKSRPKKCPKMPKNMYLPKILKVHQITQKYIKSSSRNSPKMDSKLEQI